MTYDSEAKALAARISNFVNCLGHDDGELVHEMVRDHPTLQQATVRLVINYLRAMAEKKYTDGRNEAAVNAARVMINALDEAKAGALPLI